MLLLSIDQCLQPVATKPAKQFLRTMCNPKIPTGTLSTYTAKPESD